MAKRNLKQEAFRRKHHKQLVKRGLQKPQRGLDSKHLSHSGYTGSPSRVTATVDSSTDG